MGCECAYTMDHSSANPHVLARQCRECQLEEAVTALRAENERLRGLLREVADHGRRTTVPLGPEAADLLSRIDAELGGA